MLKYERPAANKSIIENGNQEGRADGANGWNQSSDKHSIGPKSEIQKQKVYSLFFGEFLEEAAFPRVSRLNQVHEQENTQRACTLH